MWERNRKNSQAREWDVTNTVRQNDYPFPYEAPSLSVTATLSPSTSQFTARSTNRQKGDTWFSVTALRNADTGRRTGLHCDDWLIMSHEFMVRRQAGWHKGTNERLLGRSVCVRVRARVVQRYRAFCAVWFLVGGKLRCFALHVCEHVFLSGWNLAQRLHRFPPPFFYTRTFVHGN